VALENPTGTGEQPDYGAETLAQRIAERERLEARLAVERRRFAQSCQEFDSRFKELLAGYRSQRAWRVMLAIRKAYTLLARRRWRGLLRWAGDFVRGRDSGLDDFELAFPEILNFVPQDLYQIVTHELGSPSPGKRGIPSSGKYDVVILGIIDFESRFQRPQQMAVQFARLGHRVFWVSVSRFLAETHRKPYELVQLRENLWEVQLRGAPFDVYGGVLTPLAAGTLLDSIDHLYKDLGLATSCVIVQFPTWRRLALGIRERFDARVIYDCMDDWPKWLSEPKPGSFSLSEEVKLVAESDIVVVTARELRDRFAKQGVVSQLIPNGADFDSFCDAPANSLLKLISQPIIGFYGAIAEWIDVDLMQAVAKLRPNYSFVMIGPVLLDGIDGFKNLPNVHLPGEKPYRELPGYLRQFAVCTLPFRMNQLTRSVDPVKVYEYLSQGKPVVSTPLPDLAPISDLLYFAEEPEEFARQIDCALAESGDSLPRKRMAFASQNTWGTRVEAMDRSLRARFPQVSILLAAPSSPEQIESCVGSIRRNTAHPSYEIIVLDGQTTNARIEAARMAKGEYLALMNPDTIVTWGWLERLMRRLKSDPTIGLATPVSNFPGNQARIETDYRSLAEMDKLAFERSIDKWGESIPIDPAPVCCCLMPRKVWDQAGEPLNEEVVLRVKSAGYRIIAAEDCFVHSGAGISVQQDEGAGGL
jgi:glycosyltransferase involved in cell wall biosynthesis